MTEIPHETSNVKDDFQENHSPLYYRFYPAKGRYQVVDTIQTVSDYGNLRKIGAILLVTASTLAVWHFYDTTILHPGLYIIGIPSLLITILGFLGGYFAVTARHLPFVLTAPLLLLIIVYRDFTMSYGCFCPYETWVGPLMIPFIIGAEVLFIKSRTDFG